MPAQVLADCDGYIEIQGNSAVSDEAIMSVLEQLDVKQGAHIRDRYALLRA